MAEQLTGKKVAFIAVNGVEDSELSSPWGAVKNAGAEPVLISLKPGEIHSLKLDWESGNTYQVDKTIDEVKPEDFDALILPGGTLNADQLRTHEGVLDFVRHFTESSKPVSAICHAPWILVNAGLAEGRKLTSVSTISTDLKNAGADWVDAEVVSVDGITTSRTPKDLDAFNAKTIEAIANA